MTYDFNADMELIEKYLDGSLSSEEKALAEKRLAENAELREEYEYMAVAAEAVRHSALNDQVASVSKQYRINDTHSTPGKAMGKVRSLTYFMPRMAAAVVIIVASYMAVSYATATPDKVFSEGFVAYDLPSARSAAQANAIEQQYKDGNWQQVQDLLRSQTALSQKELFLGGVSALHLNNAVTANEYFQKLTEKNKTAGEKLYEQDTEFYLALTYIKLNEFEKANNILQVINNTPEHPYYSQVKKMNLLKVKLLNWKK